MPGAERQPEGRPPRRTVKEDEVPLACAAFLMAHRECDKAVEFTRGEGTLLCWCRRCNDLRSFVVTINKEPSI